MASSKKPNTKAVSIKIKTTEDNDVVFKKKAASIIFASVVESKGEASNIQAGMAGEFSLSTIVQSLESIVTATAHALNVHHDFSAKEFLELMAKVSSEVVGKTYADNGRNEAVLHALMELAKQHSKN